MFGSVRLLPPSSLPENLTLNPAPISLSGGSRATWIMLMLKSVSLPMQTPDGRGRQEEGMGVS